MAYPILVPIQGGSAAIIVPLDATGNTLSDVHATLDMMKFDNLGAGSKALIAVPAGSAAASELPNIDFVRNDGAITRLKGQNLIVDGEDGSDITSEGSSGTPTHPTVTLVLNDTPVNRADYGNFKVFVIALMELFSAPSLIVLGIGSDYAGATYGVGCFAMVGKLSSEIDLGVDGNAAKQLTLTFTGMSDVTFEAGLISTLTGAGYLPSITPTLGAVYDFPNLTSGNLDDIEAAQFVIV